MGSGESKTSMANAYSEEIEARVTADIEHLKKMKLEDKALGILDIALLETDLKGEETWTYFDRDPGFVKIKSKNHLSFTINGYDGRVYVSVKTRYQTLADNLPVGNGEGIIVSENGSVITAGSGEIWIDVDGNDHSPV